MEITCRDFRAFRSNSRTALRGGTLLRFSRPTRVPLRKICHLFSRSLAQPPRGEGFSEYLFWKRVLNASLFLFSCPSRRSSKPVQGFTVFTKVFQTTTDQLGGRNQGIPFKYRVFQNIPFVRLYRIYLPMRTTRGGGVVAVAITTPRDISNDCQCCE